MIRFEKAGVSFGEFKALDSLSLTIGQGEFVALIGPNGSGKSTFIRLINGLLLPTEGRVTVEGLDTARDDLFEIRKRAAALFQNPDNQIVAATVEDEVAFGPENLMLPAEEIEKRIDDALSFVDMLQYRQHLTANLSGGQKQRVAFASIIAMEASAYLFDEPTSLIDVQGRKKIMEIIQRSWSHTFLRRSFWPGVSSSFMKGGYSLTVLLILFCIAATFWIFSIFLFLSTWRQHVALTSSARSWISKMWRRPFAGGSNEDLCPEPQPYLSV
jgi:energy-coupling factor transporter ATP-binding protein EcfA2